MNNLTEQKVVASSTEVDNTKTNPAGHDSSLVEESSDTFYSSTGSSPPHEIPGLQLQCYLLRWGTDYEELGAQECLVATESAIRPRTDIFLETLQAALEAIRMLARRGWEVWYSERAVYFAHSTIRLKSADEVWNYLYQLGIDLDQVDLFPYSGAGDLVVSAPRTAEEVQLLGRGYDPLALPSQGSLIDRRKGEQR